MKPAARPMGLFICVYRSPLALCHTNACAARATCPQHVTADAARAQDIREFTTPPQTFHDCPPKRNTQLSVRGIARRLLKLPFYDPSPAPNGLSRISLASRKICRCGGLNGGRPPWEAKRIFSFLWDLWSRGFRVQKALAFDCFEF